VLGGLFYDSRVRLRLAILLLLAGTQFLGSAYAQEENASLHKTVQADNPKSEPKYDETFSGSIVELTPAQITVSRSILGKPAEKHSFAIKPDTRVDGKLRVRVKVTVGYVTTDDGEDIARLIVVRGSQKPSDKK